MSLEKPLEYRRLQLQLMTPKKLQGHLDCLHSNIVCVPEKTGQPICQNFIRAMMEVQERLTVSPDHFDPAMMEQAKEMAAELSSHREGGTDRRYLESLKHEAYFTLVADSAPSEWRQDVERLVKAACEECVDDRRRWDETAAAERALRAKMQEDDKKTMAMSTA